MEECCAVCAEPLEWVGYGLCGHRDVCSKCIARLRFVLNDQRCCICKQECASVFVTKALGDFTKIIGDFDTLAERGDLWYESDTQAYFDDEEHYKMIKAMCRLSCSLCEQAESAGKESVKKGYVFRNLDLLRRHLLHAHKVQMCGLCLEGRKVFISEQKLYSRMQLERHALKGDSEVDGNDGESGGFTGHPLCDFCQKRFYGDNELYQHMTRDHYTCHICQRLRPGRYDYYRNYDDLEAHFRYEHSLCEHPDCLAKKFVVFASDAELKRHNALTHGGNMSRAQRNAALQIPVSFQYRRPGQDDGGDGHFRRRGSYSNRESRSAAPSATVSPAVEHTENEPFAVVSDTNGVSNLHNFGSNVPDSFASGDAGIESLLSSSGNEPSRYRAAVSGTGPSSLEESAFPPLPGSKNARRKAKQRTKGPAVSMATFLGGGEGSRPSSTAEQSRHRSFVGEPFRSVTSESPPTNQWSQLLPRQRLGEDVEGSRQSFSAVNGPAVGESENFRMMGAGSSTGELRNGVGVQLSVDELRIANKVLIESIRSDLKGDERSFNAFKDISAEFRKGEINAKVYFENILRFGLPHLVPELARLCPDPEKKRQLLDAYEKGLNGKRPNTLKGTLPSSVERENSVNVAGSGKDTAKTGSGEEALMKATVNGTASLRLTDTGGTSDDTDVEVLSKDGYRDLKEKKTSADASYSDIAASSSSGRRNSGPSKPAKVLVKAKGKSSSFYESVEGTWTCNVCTLENAGGSSHCAACGVAYSDVKVGAQADAQGNEKRKKKTSKFQRARLGDGSAASLLESRQNALGSDVEENGVKLSNQTPADGRVIGRGAWKNGGGQRLLSLAKRDSAIESAWNDK